MPSTICEAALDYASRGWPVFPVDGKVPFPGTHGAKDATTDRDVIRAWWKLWPKANVVVLTGQRSGLVVLDVDDHGTVSGSATLATILKDNNCTLPKTAWSKTGGGGMHVLFQYPEEEPRPRTGPLGGGLELLNWFVAPPSVHPSGVRYEWVWPPDAPLAPVPPWLMALAARPPRPLSTTTEGVLLLEEGNRDLGLFREACYLRGNRGYPEEVVAAVLVAINDYCCVPPLPESVVREKARSACKYVAGYRPVKGAALSSVEMPS